MDITVEQANAIREECKNQIALADALNRLYQNKDFMFLCDCYIKEEPVRLVNLLGEASFNMSEKRDIHRKEINERMIGVARFAEYLRHIQFLASKAEQTLEDLNKAE